MTFFIIFLILLDETRYKVYRNPHDCLSPLIMLFPLSDDLDTIYVHSKLLYF